ncbi:MAG: right-handed parallel beta-helix repeat-containing protein [Sedimentisphaerales bacterium]
MKSKIFSIILSVLIFAQVCFAQVCAKLVDITAGENHTLALAEDGSLWSCGGGDGSYALGLGGISPVYSLQRIHDGEMNTTSGYLENIIAFDAGWFHSLAVDSNHFCWAWGSQDDVSSGGYGLLGNGPNEGSSNVPILVHGLNNDANGLRNIVKVAAGRSGTHSLALRNDGNVTAWGNNGSGQCGGSDQNSVYQYPKLVLSTGTDPNFIYLGDEANIVDIEAGEYHSLALASMTDGGIVYEWGNSLTYPHKVSGLSKIVDIATSYFSLAADSNGQVWYWTTGNTPTKIAGLEHIVKVAAGSSICAALDVNGQVWEWTGSSGTPAKVPDGAMQTQSGELEDIVALDVGWYDFRVAVDKYGYGWGWGSYNYYGQLGVGDTSSHPLPTEMLCPQLSSSVYLYKTYEIQGETSNCVYPFYEGLDNYLVFEISYGNPVTNPNDVNYVGTIYDVNIIDHLPLETDFNSADSNGVYDGNNGTVTWHIGELSPGEQGSVTLTVMVNEYARPCGQIINFCEMTADDYYSLTEVNVPVCQWGSDIIYVDKDANGFNNGTRWEDAFTDLQDAFVQARNTCTQTTAIWVAAGTYKPVWDANEENYQNKSFELVEGVGLFGHFAGTENSSDERNFADANNETILEGKIGTEYWESVYNVVTAANIQSAIIDGFTIKDAYNDGVYLNNADVSIANCKILDNGYYYNGYGIIAQNYSYPDIHNCLFMDNSYYAVYADSSQPDISYCVFDGNNTTSYGLYIASGSVSNITNSDFKNHNASAIQGSYATIDIEECKLSQNGYNGIDGSGLNLTVEKTIFEDNAQNGIRLYSYSDLDIKHCVIRNSGYQGIYLSQNSGTELINNWIHNNGTTMYSPYGAGIYFENQIGIPIIRNNTIYDNYTYGIECSQTGADPNILNCIITGNDSNDIYRVNGSFNKVNYCLLQNAHSGIDNRTGDPCFKNPSNPDDLHISTDSQCKNTGDPCGNYENETDIDGEARVRYGRIDIGADEYYWSPADYDEDGAVNFFDYALFAKSWRLNDANISLDDDNDVDFIDLSLFCADWLWQKTADEGWMLCMSSGEEELQMESMSLSAALISVDDSETTTSVENGIALMLTTAAESIAKQPMRLAAKSQKFYDITPDNTISARQRELALLKSDNQANIKELLKWLDELWLTDKDISDSTSEKDWQEFIKSVKDSE